MPRLRSDSPFWRKPALHTPLHGRTNFLHPRPHGRNRQIEHAAGRGKDAVLNNITTSPCSSHSCHTQARAEASAFGRARVRTYPAGEDSISARCPTPRCEAGAAQGAAPLTIEPEATMRRHGCGRADDLITMMSRSENQRSAVRLKRERTAGAPGLGAARGNSVHGAIHQPGGSRAAKPRPNDRDARPQRGVCDGSLEAAYGGFLERIVPCPAPAGC